MADAANTACIYCGKTGATVMITREHTFSDWINEVLTPADLGPDITCERNISQGLVLPPSLFEHPTAELSVDDSTQLGVDPGDLIT